MLQAGKTILRAPVQADQADLAELANNEKVSYYLRNHFPFPYKNTDAEIFINLKKQELPRMTFAIEYDEKFCGVIGLIKQNDIYSRSAELGYWLGESYWGKGIMTTAVKLITNYGLEQLKFIRIYAGIFESNSASMRVLENNGYRKEGISRKAIFKHGRIWDEYRFAITK